MVAQVDDFNIYVITRFRLLQHPLRWLVGKAGRSGRAYDQGDAGFHGHNVLTLVALLKSV